MKATTAAISQPLRTTAMTMDLTGMAAIVGRPAMAGKPTGKFGNKVAARRTPMRRCFCHATPKRGWAFTSRPTAKKEDADEPHPRYPGADRGGRRGSRPDAGPQYPGWPGHGFDAWRHQQSEHRVAQDPVQCDGGGGRGQGPARGQGLYRRQEPEPRPGRQLGGQGDAQQRRGRRHPRTERQYQGAVDRKVAAARPGGMVYSSFTSRQRCRSYLWMDLWALGELPYPKHAYHYPPLCSHRRDRCWRIRHGAIGARVDRQWRPYARDHVARRL